MRRIRRLLKNLVDNPYSTEVTFSNVKQLDNAGVLLEITTRTILMNQNL
ncbi:MAG: hypothetical protein ACLTJ5_09185 [Clostridium sp.]